MKKVNTVYLHTGSNLGDRFENLELANIQIEQRVGKIIHQSSCYETAAWGIEAQRAFINQALCVQTILSPMELMSEILDIEKEMGRIRLAKWTERLIDIDILFFNQAIIHEPPRLVVPHPRISERNFVMIPLAEIAPDFIHPIFKNISELAEKTSDILAVNKIMSEEVETQKENLIFAN